MEYASRKRRKELRSTPAENIGTPKRTDDELFKEQKNRLRRQLNSASTFSLDTNDMRLSPHTAQTRTEVKKQKKIDDILRDIAVLPENEYLDEDTNLRLLKKMSVAKQYNRLQLSPEQEEKMAENKEKFETITNQLWFLIAELEKGKNAEPAIGTVPKMLSEDATRQRQFFDVEHARTAEHMYRTNVDADFAMTNMNTKIDLLEDKLERISLKNDALEDVLQDLEKVVQEGKVIINDEVQQQAYDIGEAPDDTLELLMYLEKVEALNQTKAMKLDETRAHLKAAHTTTLNTTREQTGLLGTNSFMSQEMTGSFDMETRGVGTSENLMTEANEMPTNHTKQDTGRVPQMHSQGLRSQPAETLIITDAVEKSDGALKKSIIILSIIFFILLAFLLFMVYNYIM